jgi:predicted dehydrogenase
MLRLLVSTSAESSYTGIAERLRGASVDWDGGRHPLEPLADGFDAVAFLWPNPNMPTGLALGVRAKKDLLLINPWLIQEQAVTWMFAQARAAGVRFLVANYDRYWPRVRLIHQELASGKLGRPGLVRMHRWWQLDLDDTVPHYHLPPRLTHDLDVAIWLAAARPDVAYTCGDLAEVGAYLQVHLGFDGGAMALIDYCTRLPERSLSYGSLTVIGSAGAAYYDDREQIQLSFQGGLPQAVSGHDSWVVPSIVQDFVDGAPAEEGLAMSHAQWQWVRATVAAVRQSLATRQAVRIEAVG